MRTTVGALAIIFNKRNEVLLQMRKTPVKELQKWELPGGKIEPGETPEEAVIRECKEELNIDVRVKKLVPIIWTSVYDYPGYKVHAILIPYIVEPCKNEKIVVNTNEALRARFFDPYNINVPVLDGVKEMIQAALTSNNEN